MQKTNSRKKTGRSKRESRTSNERLIFRYWDGSKERAVDPMEVQYALTTRDNFDFDIDSKLATTDTPEAPRALRRIIDAVRAAFTVDPYHSGPPERGLTGGECMALLVEFAQFIDDLKKKLGNSLTSSPSDVLRPDLSPTPNESASSLTVPESSLSTPSSTPPDSASSSEERFPENGSLP